MAYLHTKNPNLGKFWRVLYRSILLPFRIFCGHTYILVYFIAIWNIFSRFGMLCQDKSGSPAPRAEVAL
jgi:hypothetical protein